MAILIDKITHATKKRSSRGDSGPISIDENGLIKKKLVRQFCSIVKERFQFLEFSSDLNYRFFDFGLKYGTFGVYFPKGKDFFDKKHSWYDSLYLFRYQPLNDKLTKNGYAKYVKADPEDIRISNGVIPNTPLEVNKDCVLFFQHSEITPTDYEVIDNYAERLSDLMHSIIMWQYGENMRNLPVTDKISQINQKDNLINEMARGNVFGVFSLSPSDAGSFNSKTPTNSLTLLRQEYQAIFNELKAYLGIDNIGVMEKKEHLINLEVLPETDFVTLNLEGFYNHLENFAFRFNEVYNKPLTILVSVRGRYVDLSTAKQYYGIRGMSGGTNLVDVLNTGAEKVERMKQKEDFADVSFPGASKESTPSSGSSSTGSDTSDTVPPINNNNSYPLYGPFASVETYKKLGYFYSGATDNLDDGRFNPAWSAFLNFFGRFKTHKQEEERKEVLKKFKFEERGFFDSFTLKDWFSNKYANAKARFNFILDRVDAMARVGFSLAVVPSVLTIGGGLLIWGKLKKFPGVDFADNEKNSEAIQEATYKLIEDSLNQKLDEYDKEAFASGGFNRLRLNARNIVIKGFFGLVPSAILSRIVALGVEYVKRSIIYSIFYSLGHDTAKSFGKFLPWDNRPTRSGQLAGSIAVASYIGKDYYGLAAYSLANFVDIIVKEFVISRDMQAFNKYYNALPVELVKVPLVSIFFEAILKKIMEALIDPNEGIVTSLVKTTGYYGYKLTKETVIKLATIIRDLSFAYYKEMTKNGLPKPTKKEMEDLSTAIIEKGFIKGVDKSVEQKTLFNLYDQLDSLEARLIKADDQLFFREATKAEINQEIKNVHTQIDKIENKEKPTSTEIVTPEDKPKYIDTELDLNHPFFKDVVNKPATKVKPIRINKFINIKNVHIAEPPELVTIREDIDNKTKRIKAIEEQIKLEENLYLKDQLKIHQETINNVLAPKLKELNKSIQLLKIQLESTQSLYNAQLEETEQLQAEKEELIKDYNELVDENDELQAKNEDLEDVIKNYNELLKKKTKGKK